MTLEEIIALKVGDKFLYHEKPATALWREFVEEDLGVNEKGTKLHRLHFSLHFIYADDSPVTLTSCHPKPSILRLPEFSMPL